MEPPLQDTVETTEIKAGLKRRSLSEERKSPRMKIPQRSSSLQLEPNHALMPHLASKAPVAAKEVQAPTNGGKRNSWQNFFAWSGRLVGSKRTLNEDEGFDSFHGNNSSSSDCDTEVKSKEAQQQQLSDTTSTSEDVVVEGIADPSKMVDESCTSEASENLRDTFDGSSRIEDIGGTIY